MFCPVTDGSSITDLQRVVRASKDSKIGSLSWLYSQMLTYAIKLSNFLPPPPYLWFEANVESFYFVWVARVKNGAVYVGKIFPDV